jgi:hypothetical protein
MTLGGPNTAVKPSLSYGCIVVTSNDCAAIFAVMFPGIVYNIVWTLSSPPKRVLPAMAIYIADCSCGPVGRVCCAFVSHMAARRMPQVEELSQ